MKAPAALLALATAVFWAVAAHSGPSTLVWIPATDIQPASTWHLDLDNYSALNRSSTPTDYGLLYGFARGRAEVGIDYMAGANHPVYFNAKYLIMPENRGIPALAVGVENVGTQKNVTDYDMFYAVGSRTVGPVRLTLGYCHGKRASLGADPDMLMAGVDGYLSRDKKWWGAVDFQSGTNAFGALNFGVSYNFTSNISLILGYDVYNSRALSNTVTTQLDVNF